MSAGLDGNPDPITTAERTGVIDKVVALIQSEKRPDEPLLVAIDGIDGSGKTTFANEVAGVLAVTSGLSVIRATIDSFHNPREIRWQRGRSSPVGFYLDSHNLDSLRTELLDPFTAGTGSSYRTAVFDEPTDAPIESQPLIVASTDVLIIDGIFLQRPELADYWDLTLFLDGQDRVGLQRLGLVLDNLPDDSEHAVFHTMEWAERFERYQSGMRYYLDLVSPADRAGILIDNNDLAHPFLQADSRPSSPRAILGE